MALDAAEEQGEPDPGDDGGDDGAGESWGETVDPVTGEVQLTLPLWTQGTLPGMGMAPGNAGERRGGSGGSAPQRARVSGGIHRPLSAWRGWKASARGGHIATESTDHRHGRSADPLFPRWIALRHTERASLYCVRRYLWRCDVR